jgi:hypothetical protein
MKRFRCVKRCSRKRNLLRSTEPASILFWVPTLITVPKTDGGDVDLIAKATQESQTRPKSAVLVKHISALIVRYRTATTSMPAHITVCSVVESATMTPEERQKMNLLGTLIQHKQDTQKFNQLVQLLTVRLYRFHGATLRRFAISVSIPAMSFSSSLRSSARAEARFWLDGPI